MDSVGSSGGTNSGSSAPSAAAKPPEISVVIPCFNARSVLESCLGSIYSQPPARTFEVIVVNDGSTDGTPDMVRANFPQVRLLDNPKNLGYSRSTNRGIAAAGGRFVHLLNSDVVFDRSGALDLLADHLERHPEVGAAGTLLYNADGTVQASVKALPSFVSAVFGARSFVSRLWPRNRFTRRELLHWKAEDGAPFPVGYISSASLMIPRRVLDRVGDLDPAFFHFADADLCKRIWNLELPVVCVPRATALHDAHKGGTVVTLARRFRLVASFHRGAYLYYRKHSGTAPWHPVHAAVVAGLGLRGLVAIGAQVVEELLSLLQGRQQAPAEIDELYPLTEMAAPISSDVDVTIVIPNYNTRARLQSCLASLYSHDWKRRFEVSVVDDASADGSADMVRSRFPQAHLLVNRLNLGYGRSCNLAIAESKGRYIYLVNNDVEVLPGVVDSLADFLDLHPEAGAAGSLLFNSDGSIQRSVKAHPSFRSAFFGARSYFSKWFPANPFTRAELLHWRASEGAPFTAGYVSSASLMVRREEFARVGALDPKLTYFNDADFCRRLWKSGRQVYYVPQAQAIHHDHQGGTLVSRRRRFLSVIEFHRGAFRYYRRHSGRPAWHPMNALVVLGLAWRFVPCIVALTARELTGNQRTA